MIVGYQATISLLNKGDVPEGHTTIWVAMGDIMKKLVSHRAKFDVNRIMRELTIDKE